MARAYLLLFIIAAASAQKQPDTAQKAPPKVEAALRARVNQFYQFEVDGKFRQAEPFVAQESKDFYYSANKPRYTGFSIRNIEFSEDFKRATVIMQVSRLVPIPGFEGKPVPGAQPSHWKVEKGKWCWYADPSDTRALPFPAMGPGLGGMPLPGAPIGGGAPGTARSLPPIPNMSAQVQVNKTNLQLSPTGPSSGQVTVLNTLRTPVTLVARDPNVAGLSVKLDHTDLKTGEKAILDVQSSGSSPAPAQPVTITVVVKQTNQVIPIKVSFGGPTKP